MRFLSVCSGIEAASVAWKSLGWRPLAFSEIEKFPRAVLKHHYPDVPCHGDFTKLRDEPWIVDADMLCGGTPCQAFSIAGLRKSLGDDRGNLSLEFVRLANAIDDLRRPAGKRECFIVWENVPGVLSVTDNAFGAFLGGLVGSESPIDPGGKWSNAGVVAGPRRIAAWRVLDAQHFGVPQRRRRVFVLAHGHSRGWQCADALLSISNRLQGHPAPRREAREAVAALTANGVGTCGADGNQGRAGHLIPQGFCGETAPTLNAAFGSKLGLDNQHIDSGAGLFIAHSLRGEDFDASEDGMGRGTPLVPVAYRTTGNDGAYETGDIVGALDTQTDPNARIIAFSAKDYGADAMEDCAPTLRAGGHSESHANAGVMPAVAFDTTQITSASNYSNPKPGDPCHPLAAGAHPPAIAGSAVRRLTPEECEALQGFPRLYTAISWRGKPADQCPDGPRYEALGNSWAVPCARWIGERIDMVERINLESSMREAAA